MEPLKISKYCENLLNSHCLSVFGLIKQYTINWLAYKQQTFISPRFGAWEVQE